VESVHNHSSSVLSDVERDPLRPVLSKSESGEGARQTLANVILPLELLVLTFKFFPQKQHLRALGSRGLKRQRHFLDLEHANPMLLNHSVECIVL
jgi:hypothetical protein